jgi:hypothetical protein
MLLRALLAARLLREVSFLGVEALVRSPARQAMGVRVSFGDDVLAYLTERLNVPYQKLKQHDPGRVPRGFRRKTAGTAAYFTYAFWGYSWGWSPAVGWLSF